MAKRTTQGAVTVEEEDNGRATAYVQMYAMSLVATRQVGDKSFADHEASSAFVASEDEAYKQGLKEAGEKWPAAQGWKHMVKVRHVQMTFVLAHERAAENS